MRPILLAVALVTLAAPAFAQDDDDLRKAVEVRQGMYKLYGNYFGPLAGMARGEIDYDAETARTAAESLAAVASIDRTGFFPEGTSSEAMEGSAALPAIWEDMDDFTEGFDGVESATQSLAASAGDGLDALKQGVGQVGQSCKGCHDDYRMDD